MKKLSNEELIERYRNEIDEIKKDEILSCFFEKNNKYAHYIAKKYKHHDLVHEDIVGLATIGMMKALHSFDLTKGFKFITYATRLMVNEILMQFRKADYKKNVISLDVPLSNDTENMTLLDVLPDNDTHFEENFEQRELVRLAMEQAKTLLTDKEYVVVSNLLVEIPKTQRELSMELNLSQSYVSRLEAKGLKKIRVFLENPSLTKEKAPMIQAPPKKAPEVPLKEEVPSKELPLPSKETVQPKVQHTLQIEGKTVLDKVRYVMQHYPDLSVEEMAKTIQASLSTVRTYVSQIKQKQGGEQPMTVVAAAERKTNLNENDLKIVAEIKKMEEEHKRLQNIAKEAMEKMLQFSKEKEDMAKQMASYEKRMERLDQLNHLLMAELVAVRGEQQTA